MAVSCALFRMLRSRCATSSLPRCRYCNRAFDESEVPTFEEEDAERASPQEEQQHEFRPRSLGVVTCLETVVLACSPRLSPAELTIRQSRLEMAVQTRRHNQRAIKIAAQIHATNATRKPTAPANETQEYLQAAIIGMANVGKSTLANALVETDVCLTSRRPHTTLYNVYAYFNDGNKQVALVDTPGIIRSLDSRLVDHTMKLEPRLQRDPERSLAGAGLIVCVVDASRERFNDNRKRLTEIHPRILYTLHKYEPIPAVLVVNKIDRLISELQLIEITHRLTGGIVDGVPIGTESIIRGTNQRAGMPLERSQTQTEKLMRRRAVLRDRPLHMLTDREIKRAYHGRDGYTNFSAVFYTSATHGTGISELRECLLAHCKPGRWRFADDAHTDQTPAELCLQAVRAALLEQMPNAIPYTVPTKLVAYERTPSGMHEFNMQLLCENDKTVSMIMGFFGERMRLVAQNAEQALRNALCEDVKIRIQVTVHPLAIARRQERKRLTREEERRRKEELNTLINNDTRWSRAT